MPLKVDITSDVNVPCSTCWIRSLYIAFTSLSRWRHRKFLAHISFYRLAFGLKTLCHQKMPFDLWSRNFERWHPLLHHPIRLPCYRWTIHQLTVENEAQYKRCDKLLSVNYLWCWSAVTVTKRNNPPFFARQSVLDSKFWTTFTIFSKSS